MCYEKEAHQIKIDKIEKHYKPLTVDSGVMEIPNRIISFFAQSSAPVITWDVPRVQLMDLGWHPPYMKGVNDYRSFGQTWNSKADALRERILDDSQKKKGIIYPISNEPAVVVVNSYFEFHTKPGKTKKDDKKYKYRISMKDGQSFAIAGVCKRDYLNLKTNEHRDGFTLHTIAANEIMGAIHNKPAHSSGLRMPAILHPSEIAMWLDPSIPVVERLAQLKPYPSEEMKAVSVMHTLRKDLKEYAGTDKALEPFDYHTEGVPLEVDGANVKGFEVSAQGGLF